MTFWIRPLRDALGPAEEALAAYERVLADDPLNLFFRGHLANFLLTSGRIPDAIRVVRQALEREDGKLMALGVLLRCTVAEGKLDEAVRMAEELARLLPWYLDSSGWLAGLLSLTGEDERAAQVLWLGQQSPWKPVFPRGRAAQRLMARFATPSGKR